MKNNIPNMFIAVLISILMGFLVLNFQIFSFGVLIVLLINLIIFLSPRHFILFWLVVAGFSSNIQLPGGITSYGAMNLIFLPSLVLKTIADYQKEIFQFPVIKFYLAFLAIYFISIWYSPVPHFKCFRQYWTFVIPLLMAILVTGSFRDAKVIEKYLKITLTCVALLSILSSVMFMLGKWKSSVGIDRASGFFDHPNLYAMYLNFHLGVSLSLAMFLNKRKEQIFYYVISFILCISLVPTFAKGAYITCFLMFLFLSILAISIKREVSHVLILLGFVFTFVLFGLTFFHATIMHRLSNEDTFLWRLNLWKGLMKYALQSPIWGHGYLSYYQFAGDVLGISSGFAPHSLFFIIFLDVGLIGLVAFFGSYLGMMGYALRVFLISPKENFAKALSLGLVVTIVATMFNSFTENGFFIPMVNLYLWFYFGFLVALVNIEKKMAKSNV